MKFKPNTSQLPILIPARNEADHIARTLGSLPGDVEPIVITNECIDDTAQIAESFGATLIENEKGGKLPALQTGLRYLGSRALGPVLFLDADSKPVTKSWARIMEHASSANDVKPRLTGGLVYFTRGIDPASGFIYSFKPVIEANRKSNVHFRGANVSVRIGYDDLLDTILDLPNYWPGDEPALVDAFEAFGGEVTQLFDPRAIVATDGSRLTSLMARLRHGGGYTHDHFADSYRLDASLGTVPYPLVAIGVEQTT